MARLAEAICGLAAIAGRRISLRTAGGAGFLWRTAALRASSPIPASKCSGGRGRVERRRFGARGRRSRAGGRARGRASRPQANGRCQPSPGRMPARTDGFPLLRHNVFFSRDYPDGIRRHLRTRRIAAGADRLCLRAGSRRRRNRRPLTCDRARLPASSTRRRTTTRAPFPRRSCRHASKRRSELAGEVRPADRVGSGCDRAARRPADFARLYPVERRERSTAGRRTAGGRRSCGRGRRHGCRGSTWRAAACIRGLGRRWRRCRAGWRRARRWRTFASTRRSWPGATLGGIVDAISDDQTHGLTIIAFVGSVFSPYYAWKRARRDPLDHCAVNVALYGPRSSRWAMTERDRAAVTRDRDWLAIGRSSAALERRAAHDRHRRDAVPRLPLSIRGRVEVRSESINLRRFVLELQGRHLWRPIAPQARVAVDLDRPSLHWRGDRLFRP